MLTIFGTPKKFNGTTKNIQMNAIGSWCRLISECDVVLYTNDNDCELDELKKNYRIIVAPVKCNIYGTPLINHMYEDIQCRSRHDICCYINCDIIIVGDLINAIIAIEKHSDEDYLVIGRRWNIDSLGDIDFVENWKGKVLEEIELRGTRQGLSGTDFMVFRRGSMAEIPEFAVGRPGWDNYMIYKAKKEGKTIYDIGDDVCMVHQNHDYQHHRNGKDGVWGGDEAKEHSKLTGGNAKMLGMRDADYQMVSGKIRKIGGVRKIVRDVMIWPLMRYDISIATKVTRRMNKLYKTLKSYKCQHS